MSNSSPGQRLRESRGGVERDGCSLREPGQHDPSGGDTALAFPGDQFPDLCIGAAKARRIFGGPAVQSLQIVPGAHGHAAVQGHGANRRVGEDKAPRAFTPPHDLGDDGLEIVAIGSEAMQPDDGGGGFCGGFYFDCV